MPKLGSSSKPYGKKRRAMTVTVPNAVIDRILEDMETKGEENLSSKVSGILQWWIDVALDGADPSPMLEEAKARAKKDGLDLEGELARFQGFSGSPFVG